ncbi:protein translocase subunit SecD [Candidatus Uabimicrobium amorphum]|uniref:Multifunctional fusion protein n=1 Tax=Uabimicrobium amorphum TaxID=2596890 RepID=A0A5S9IMM0_UABAM|nr:protein translocase subunit SecD [Candidatus Uabimicrobium amorphum]BBM84317.1 protein translocase subunit SecDF [Candidatus Uabimicrobium amorphum]
MYENNPKIWTKCVLILCLVSMSLLLICPPSKRPFFQEDLQETKINLGLDLKGGSELLYEIDLQELDPHKTAQQVMDDSISVIYQRIFDSGIVKEPRINRQGKNRILVQLPGLNDADTEKIKDAIEQLGNLRWCLVASPQVGGKRSFDEAVESTRYEKAKQRGQRALDNYRKQLLSLGYKWFQDKGGGERLLWIGDSYNITGKDLRHVQFDSLHQQIHFRLTISAGKNFKKLTAKYQGEILAIVFNNKIVSVAQIGGVVGDSGSLTGFTAKQANVLIKTMKSGSLDIKPQLLYKNTIGPSIGEDSVRLGVYSALFSFAAVILFIAIYYLTSGIVASLTLLLNILLVFVVLMLFRETLTLPGIAGLILTVGMSIDANIIIFERIREEQAKRLQTVDKQILLDDVDRGFQKSFRTILDANITTFFTAAILYMIASGAIKGFAFTMLWGIALSFFTAIFVTKTFLRVLIMINMSNRLRMMQIVKKPSFAFTSKMRKWGIVSCFAVALCTVGFLKSSERIYGLDLRGGVLVQMSLKKPLETTTVRERLRKNFQGDFEVQRLISPRAKNREFSIRLSQENTSQSQMRQKIRQLFSAELAEKAFGDITKISRGKLRNFVSMPIHLHTPVSVDFLKATFAKSPFEKVLIAVPKVTVHFELQKAQGKRSLKKEIIRHLALARPTIKVQHIEIHNKNNVFTAQISFLEHAPLESIHQAMQRCKFAKFHVQPQSDFANLMAEFTLLVDLPSGKDHISWGETKQYLEKTVRDIFQQKEVHLSDPFPRVAEISSVVAKQQKTSAYRAILLSLIFILLYITARFPNGWNCALAAIITLAHDIAITVGMITLFSSMGWVNVEMNLPVIAALLTIVGYSLNDTIIIFDRLRENRENQEERLPIKKVAEIFDRSINQTLSRTILTSFTTLLVAVILFVFNYNTGNVLEGFAFTLIVGIIVGTYSSIFVASALALRFESRAR